MTASWAVEVKFDGSTWTDITSYVRQVNVRRGRSGDLDVVEPGVLSVELDNDDGRFTPENTQGAYTPNVRPGVTVRVSVTAGEASDLYRLFTGDAQRWEPSWTVGGRPVVTLEAVDGFEKLQRYTIDYPHRRVVLSESPDGYWPLGDTGSTYYDVSGNGRNLGVGNFRDSGSSSNDGLSSVSALVSGGPGAAEWDNTSGDNRAHLVSQFSPPESWWGMSNDLTFSCVVKFDPFNVQPFSLGLELVIVRDDPNIHDNFWSLELMDDGELRFSAQFSNVTSDPLTWTSGRAYHVGVHFNHSTKQVKLYRDGSLIKSGTNLDSPGTPGDARLMTSLEYVSDESVVTISEMALWTSDKSALMSDLGSSVDGFPSDTPGERIERVLDWAGWDASDRSVDDGTTSLAAMGSTTSALEVCQNAAAADGGVFYISKTGDATFQGRRNRWESESGSEYADGYSDTYGSLGGAVFVFDDDGTDTGYRAMGWRYDTTLLENRVVVNSNTQGVSDGIASDATSQTTYGERALSIPTVSNSTSDNQQRAEWELSRRKDPHLRLEEVTFLASTTTQEDVAGVVELQDRADVNRRPGAGQDDITAEMRVSEIVHTIADGGKDWRVTLGLAEASTDQPGVYGVAVYGDDYYGY